MKKWLIRCLTVLAMVCLIPGIALNAKAVAYAFTYCIQCKADKTCDILGYVWQSNADPIYHKIRIKCRTCRTENEIIYKQFSYHTGGTETPTCTTGKICRLCWSEYGILGHAWGEWSSAGNGTHIRSCTRSNCDAVDTANCTGGTATCSAKAVCVTCGAEYGEKDSNNHALEQHAAKAPTCTEIGWDAYETCSRCDYTTYAELPALKHDLEQHEAQAPTCTEIGWDAYETCSRCDYTTRKELPALNHDLVQHEAQAPTCTEIGWDAYSTCKNCDYNTYAEVPALNHALVQHEAQAPTCTEPGWNAYSTCKNCNYNTYAEQPALNHALVQHEAQAPTCTEIGWDAYETCSRCNYNTYAEQPALNHALVQHAAKAPTCTEPGWNAYSTCKNCDYNTYQELPALNHALVNHDAKAPTCTEIGWNAYKTCSRCDHTTYAELPALNHALVQHAAKASTCTEIGWNAYETCSRCDYTTYAELPALNHNLVQHEAKAPTCTEIGWDTYEACSRSGCNYTTRKEQSALNHNLVQHEAKAPTCTEIGWDAYDTCSRCDYTTCKELPALNHALVQHAAKAPTCTEKGWDAYDTCSRCDYTTRKELPALNHDYQAVTVAPTCETDGYTVFTCSRCKDSYTADPTDKLGHQFGAWSPNGTGSQSADCLRQGCAHTGSTDCRKFTFRTAEGETLTFCPVCGQAENAAQLEKIEAATAWPLSGSLSAEDVTARTNGEYLSVAFETAGSLTQPTGRVRLALPAGLLEGKTLVRIAPDGTQTELPFETERGKLIYTLDFANSELPVMLFRLVPQTAAL